MLALLLMLPWTYADLSLAPGPVPAPAQAAPQPSSFASLSPEARRILARISAPPADHGPPVSPAADFQSRPTKPHRIACPCGGDGCDCDHPGACDVVGGVCRKGETIDLDRTTTVVVPPPTRPVVASPAPRWLEVSDPAGWLLWGRQGDDGRVYSDGPERWMPVPRRMAAPVYTAPVYTAPVYTAPAARWYYVPRVGGFTGGCAGGQCGG